MKKDDFLELFKMKELYYNKQKELPFSYCFEENLFDSDCTIDYFFYDHEIILNLKTKDFSPDTKEIKELILTFEVENEHLNIVKYNEHVFKNSLFTHLLFEENILPDLEFLSSMINDVLIPKNHLKWFYQRIY